MMKKSWIVLFSLFFCLSFSVFFPKKSEAQSNQSTVTLTIHEAIPAQKGGSSDDSQDVPLVDMTVSVYDITAAYQQMEQIGTIDLKKFSEEWLEKATSNEQDLGTPLMVAQTNNEGICQFQVPLMNNRHYASYLVVGTKEDQGTIIQPTLPSVLVFPIISPKTGELLDPIDVYPKQYEGGKTEPSKPEKPMKEVPKKTVPKTEEDLPYTNEQLSNLWIIGLLLVGVVASRWVYIKNKDTAE